MKNLPLVLITALITAGAVFILMSSGAEEIQSTPEPIEEIIPQEVLEPITDQDLMPDELLLGTVLVSSSRNYLAQRYLSVVIENPEFYDGAYIEGNQGDFELRLLNERKEIIDEMNIDYYNPFIGDGGQDFGEEALERNEFIWTTNLMGYSFSLVPTNEHMTDATVIKLNIGQINKNNELLNRELEIQVYNDELVMIQ